MVSVRTKFEFPAHYVDGLRPKKLQNNEFVECGLKNWALVNQTNPKKDSNDKRMKRKKGCVENVVLGKVRGGPFFSITHKSNYKFYSRMLYCFSPFLPVSFRSPNLVSPFFFYTLPSFHLHLPSVC